MANDHTACIYFALWIYIIIRTIGMLTGGLNAWWSWWPILTYTIFISTRIIENAWLNIKFYVILVVPINIALFGAGISVFVFCSEWLGDSMVIYLIVFSLQCIQMLIFIWVWTIILVEGISISRLTNRDEYDPSEPLLHQALTEEEIEQICLNLPDKISAEDSWSIWLCEFDMLDGTMQMRSWKHIFHKGCISSWLERDWRWPNCNTDVRQSLETS